MKELCDLCNSAYDLEDYIPNLPIPTKMREQHICFQCAFWLNRYEIDAQFYKSFNTNDNYVKYLVDELCMPLNWGDGHWSVKLLEHRNCPGLHYFLHFSGFLVCTSNMYHQGTIPPRFEDLFPINCIKLEYAKYLEIRTHLDSLNTTCLPKSELLRYISEADLEKYSLFLQKLTK